MTNRVANAKLRISNLEDFKSEHAKTAHDLNKEIHLLKSKMTYLESQSKRNNLVFVGLKEGLFESPNPGTELGEILKYILDLNPESGKVPEVERQHRALRPRPGPDDPPRLYIVRMLKWSDRQRILTAAKEKKALKWHGKPFHLFQDHCIFIYPAYRGLLLLWVKHDI